jgi:hypothetical protein
MALSAFWQHTPPAALQLRRIALALGIKLPEPQRAGRSSNKPQDALQQAMAAGLPVMEGRPDDPMLDLLDL